MDNPQSSSPDKNIVDRRKPKKPSSHMVSTIRRHVNNSGHALPLAYEPERIANYAKNHIGARIALPLFIIIIFALMQNWVGIFVAAYWAILTTLAYGLLIAFCRRYLKSEDDEITLASWRRRFLFAQLSVASCWIFFGLYSCSSCNAASTYSIIQFSTILVLQAITMILSYGFGAALLATSAPVTIVLALSFMLSYEPATMVMGGILIGSQSFFYLIANRFRLSLLSDLGNRAEREALIAELETAKSMSEEARHRAEEANLAKSRFLATMSHELRTPLNAILGFSEIMQTEVLGPIGNESYKEYIGDIHSSGNHLLNVINEILDLSRIEAGRQNLAEEAIRLSHVVEEASQMVQLKATQKNIQIIDNMEDAMPMIWADEKAVRQIVLNLLSNALKFTPSGGTITINVGWTSTGGQYLSIKDSGPGIPEEEIPIVLSSFGQGSIAIKNAEQGSGLGLPIVQAMMALHEGKFELKSKLRGGTEAIASFPRSRVLEIMERTENTGTRKQRKNNIVGLRKVS